MDGCCPPPVLEKKASGRAVALTLANRDPRVVDGMVLVAPLQGFLNASLLDLWDGLVQCPLSWVVGSWPHPVVLTDAAVAKVSVPEIQAGCVSDQTNAHPPPVLVNRTFPVPKMAFALWCSARDTMCP